MLHARWRPTRKQNLVYEPRLIRRIESGPNLYELFTSCQFGYELAFLDIIEYFSYIFFKKNCTKSSVLMQPTRQSTLQLRTTTKTFNFYKTSIRQHRIREKKTSQPHRRFSARHGCGKPQFPGVYARVSSVRAWMDDIVFG